MKINVDVVVGALSILKLYKSYCLWKNNLLKK